MMLEGYHASYKAIEAKPEVFRATLAIDYGPGFYFASNIYDTGMYGSNVYRATLSLENPIVVGSPPDEHNLQRMMRALQIDAEDMMLGGGLVEGSDDTWTHLFAAIKIVIEMGLYTFKGVAGMFLKLGYDGVIIPREHLAARWLAEGSKNPPQGDYIVVFSPDAIHAWERLPWGSNQRSEGIGLRGLYGLEDDGRDIPGVRLW